jgi:ABC-type polysaccharide/polyol phosphate transport system ATPase subunit
MMSDLAIEVCNVSKHFRLYHNPVTGPVKELLIFWRKRDFYRDFVAVKDVSLRVRRGEVVGLIGANGAGKSTLLKMIAGLLPVDEGSITVNGKLTALLTLGVGIHPEFTGRQNIFYSGLLMGMSREEVVAKTPSILEFSELKDYIDQPFRTYSAGMKARLMFSIAMSVDPDVMVIDEALAAGDQQFVKKCFRRIRQICESGATVLFVSHDKVQIQRLCSTAYFLAHGEIHSLGKPAEVVQAYDRYLFEKYSAEAAQRERGGLQMINGTGDVVLERIETLSANGDIRRGFVTGETVSVDLHYRKNVQGVVDCYVFCGFIHNDTSAFVGEWTGFSYFADKTRTVQRRKLCLSADAGVIRLTLNPLLLTYNEFSLWISFSSDDLTVLSEYKFIHPFFVTGAVGTDRGGAFFCQPGSVELL